jgi:hypothetical protein
MIISIIQLPSFQDSNLKNRRKIPLNPPFEKGGKRGIVSFIIYSKKKIL